MKRRALCFFVILVFLFGLSVQAAFADNRDTTVYITDTGRKYHTGSCSYLSQSKHAISLEDAVARGYTACSRCHPPLPDFGSAATPKPSTPSDSATRSYSYGSSRSYSSSAAYSAQDSSGSISSRSVNSNGSPGPLFVTAVIASLVTFFITKSVVNSKNERRRQEEQIRLRHAEWLKEEEEKKRKLAEEEDRKRQIYLAERKIYAAQLSGKTTLEAAGAPVGCYVGGDGKPAFDSGEYWGEGYTFFVSSSSRKFHSPTCRLRSRTYMLPVNANDIRHSQYQPCAYCRPVLPDLRWYEEYKRISAIRRKYDLPENAHKPDVL